MTEPVTPASPPTVIVQEPSLRHTVIGNVIALMAFCALMGACVFALRVAVKTAREVSDYVMLEDDAVISDDAEATIDVMRERGTEYHLVRDTAWKVSCGTNLTHVSWACKAEDETKIIYRGGSDVATDGGLGLMYCDSATNANCASDLIAGDTAHAWLMTNVDAGVDVRCSCAYK